MNLCSSMGREACLLNRLSKDYVEQLDVWFELNELGGPMKPEVLRVFGSQKISILGFM